MTAQQVEPRSGTTPFLEAVNGPITERDALGWLPHVCFRTGPPRQVGLELELLLSTRGVDAAPVSEPRHAVFVDDLRRLRLASRLTVEPGGQVELSGPPAPDVAAAVTVLGADLDRVRRQAARHGVRLVGAGLDPYRAPRRILTHPRYAAMEAYFDRTGRAGRLMMCSTASVQVNVEAGGGADDATVQRRWSVLHAVGPALVAAFANSPLYRGRASGWATGRQAVWWALDAARTRAVRPLAGESLGEAWARWCLDAPLLLVRRPGTHARWTAPAGVRFRDWIRHGPTAVPGCDAPTLDDLAYHLTTLFPPVRARGHLEVRYLDAQPGDGWRVPAAVVSALVDDPRAADLALDACEATKDRWLDAARRAVHDPQLRRAATTVLAAAAASLRARCTTRPLGDLVEDHLARWTTLGRTPGDDLLDRLNGTGVPR
jgi:glutamate--cysteine ligase